LNYILLRARDADNHHGVRNDFPSFAAGAMKKKWDEIKREGFRNRPFLNFNAETEAKEDADRWYEEFMLGRRTIVEDDGTQALRAQEDIDQPPLEMLLQSIQAVLYQDRAKREKAEGFDLAREQKRRENTERTMWENIERENQLLNN